MEYLYISAIIVFLVGIVMVAKTMDGDDMES